VDSLAYKSYTKPFCDIKGKTGKMVN